MGQHSQLQWAGQDLVPHLLKENQRCFLHSLKVWFHESAIFMPGCLHLGVQCFLTWKCMYGKIKFTMFYLVGLTAPVLNRAETLSQLSSRVGKVASFSIFLNLGLLFFELLYCKE